MWLMSYLADDHLTGKHDNMPQVGELQLGYYDACVTYYNLGMYHYHCIASTPNTAYLSRTGYPMVDLS